MTVLSTEVWYDWAELMDCNSVASAVQEHLTWIEKARKSLTELGGDPSTVRIHKQYSLPRDEWLYRMTMEKKS